jgi:hypothetical protein
MSEPREPVPATGGTDGTVRILGLPPVVSELIHDLPRMLQRTRHPAAQKRLYPDALPRDPAASTDFRRLTEPDLRRLFEAAEATVARDLRSFDRTSAELVIPEDHVAAWMSALNQARLAIGEIYRVTPADMERDDLDPHLARDLALLRIYAYGYLLERFVTRAHGAHGPRVV